MPSNAKGDSGSTRKSRKSSTRINKASSKTKKTRKPKKSQEELNAEMKAAFSQVKKEKRKKKRTSTGTAELVPVGLLSPGELESVTRENSFLLNPILANASIQKDLNFANRRMLDFEKLHDHIFDPLTFKDLDEKTIVNLYSIAVQDHHKTIAEKLKIAELSDKVRLIRETAKYYAEQEKQREIEAEDTSHTSEVIQALISESMRHAMEDELQKKWGGSNSYRPPEDTNYEILAKDPDSED